MWCGAVKQPAGTEEHCVLLTTVQLSRGGLTEPGWEAPQGKHLLDTSACLSAAASVCLSSFIWCFVSVMFL